MAYACGCPEAHIHVAQCSTPATCRGQRHHIRQFLRTVPREELRREAAAVAAELGEEPAAIEAACDDAEGVCDAACRCVCHLCTDRCHDYAIARRDEREHGPLPCLLASGGAVAELRPGGERRAVTELIQALRTGDVEGTCDVPPCAAATPIGRATPPPQGAHLVGLPVAFRVEADELVFDTLIVDTESDWAALTTAERTYLFAPPTEDPVFQSYVGYLAFVCKYGRRPYTLASAQQVDGALAVVAEWVSETRRRGKSREAASRVLTAGRTPRPSATPVSLRLLILRQYEAVRRTRRVRSEEMDREVGAAFDAAGAVAMRIARDGDTAAALDIFTELWADVREKRRRLEVNPPHS